MRSDFELLQYALRAERRRKASPFEVMGDGPIDIILVPGIVSHV